MQFAVCSILIPFTRYLDEYKIYLEQATSSKISNNFFLNVHFCGTLKWLLQIFAWQKWATQNASGNNKLERKINDGFKFKHSVLPSQSSWMRMYDIGGCLMQVFSAILLNSHKHSPNKPRNYYRVCRVYYPFSRLIWCWLRLQRS